MTEFSDMFNFEKNICLLKKLLKKVDEKDNYFLKRVKQNTI